MWLYLDTSALLKLYIDEARHAEMQDLREQADALCLSRLAWVEASSAFARRIREKPSDRPGLEQARGVFAQEWDGYRIVEVTSAIAKRAAEFTDAFALRAYDAVQLASADELRRNLDETVTFACFDQRLSQAARVLGLDVPFGAPP